MFPFTSTPMLQQTWSPDAMYSQANLQPYESESFLNQIFNFNQQSIAAYQTLPHELKLQFFLSVQEMKLLGYMSDKARYQSILQQIARRKLILQKPTVTPQQSQRKQSQQWGAKLENLCDDHLKKMQKDNFLDDIPVSYPPAQQHQQQKQMGEREVDFLSGETGKKGNDDEEFQWTEPAGETPVLTKNNSYDQEVEKLRHKSFDELFVVKPSKAPEIPAQKVEHIDVWDLQVIDQQPKNKKQPSFQKTENSSKSIQNNEQIWSNGINFQQNKLRAVSNGSIMNGNYSNNYNNTFKQAELPAINVQKHQQIPEPQPKNIAQTPQTNKQQQQQDEQFQWQDNIPNQQPQTITDSTHTDGYLNTLVNDPVPVTESINSITLPINTPINSHLDIDFEMGIEKKNNNVVEGPSGILSGGFLDTIPTVQKPQKQQERVGSYNFIQTLETPNTNPNANTNAFEFTTASKIDNIGSTGVGTDIAFNFDVTGFNFTPPEIQNSHYDTSMLNSQYMTAYIQQPIQQQQQNNPTWQPSPFLSTIDLRILQPLRQKPPAKILISSLNKKYFDFDRIFYQEALSLIQALGFGHGPDYTYVKEQEEICEEIFRLTELYTAAVDQDKEDQVRESLRKSKMLYMKLDSKKTANIMRKFVKMEGKSLSYEIGRLSLQAGVPKQLIQQALPNPKFTQIATLLYLLVFLGNTYNTSIFALQVLEYIQHIHTEMQQLLETVKNMDKLAIEVIRQDSQFIRYGDCVREIMGIARRVVWLGGLCVKGELSSNSSTVMALMDKIVPSQSTQQLVPTHFLTFFQNFACSESSNIYTLHSKIQQFITQHPLCSLCLQSITQVDKGTPTGSLKEDNKHYHYKCWNFRLAVISFKTKMMEDMEIKEKKEDNEMGIKEQDNGNQRQSQDRE